MKQCNSQSVLDQGVALGIGSPTARPTETKACSGVAQIPNEATTDVSTRVQANGGMPGMPRAEGACLDDHVLTAELPNASQYSPLESCDAKCPQYCEEAGLSDGGLISASPPDVEIVVSRVRHGEVPGVTVAVVRRHNEALTEENIHDGVDIGFFPAGEPLRQVSGLLQQVFLPLMSQLTGGGHEKIKSEATSGQHSEANAELSAALEKFVSQLRTSEAHLTGSVQLAIPALDTTAVLGRDDDALAILESCIHEWTLVLQEVKHTEGEKNAQGDGPLDEIHFWREKNNVLGGLHEQIHMPAAQRIIEYAAEAETKCCYTLVNVVVLGKFTGHDQLPSCV